MESIREYESGEVIILRAAGTVGWASDRPPREVMLDVLDVTKDIERSGDLYILPLPETAGKAVLSITW